LFQRNESFRQSKPVSYHSDCEHNLQFGRSQREVTVKKCVTTSNLLDENRSEDVEIWSFGTKSSGERHEEGEVDQEVVEMRCWGTL
jgi:hypothetical protein